MLDFLFGTRKQPDPTEDWPVLDHPTPALDCGRMAVGALPFGASLLDAVAFGKPDTFEWLEGSNCSLLHASKGYALEFGDGQLEAVAYFVGPDPHQPQSPRLCFSSPLVDGTPLSGSSTRDELEAAFGKPTVVDEDENETVLRFNHGGLELECELNAAGTLKRLAAWI